jgi:hypothetical protein
MFHIGDPWSPYKSTREHNQEMMILERDLERKGYEARKN